MTVCDCGFPWVHMIIAVAVAVAVVVVVICGALVVVMMQVDSA